MDFDHKIWGAVSVMMEGVYPGWPIFRLSNPILGCFTCYEGLFQQISDNPFLHVSNFQSVMPACAL
jgi:hypothetical protein